MTDLDRKLAILASLTGRNPLLTNYKSTGINCDGTFCAPCPFSNTDGSCNEPGQKSKALEKATIRTYKDALNSYPEYFL